MAITVDLNKLFEVIDLLTFQHHLQFHSALDLLYPTKMPRAVRGKIPAFHHSTLLTSTRPGVLIECDPSVKAIILKYDEERHDYVVEDLDDDRHLVIKESQLQNLKARLNKVCRPRKHGALGILADRDGRIWTRNSCSRTNRNRNNHEIPLPLLFFFRYPEPRYIWSTSY